MTYKIVSECQEIRGKLTGLSCLYASTKVDKLQDGDRFIIRGRWGRKRPTIFNDALAASMHSSASQAHLGEGGAHQAY